MKRVFTIAVIADLVVLALVFHSSVKDFLWTHPWWHSTLAALPTIALPVFAYLDWRDPGEANRRRGEANDLRSGANVLRNRIADLEAERNEHLQEIAKNTRRPITQAERNAPILRRHLGERVRVAYSCGKTFTTALFTAVGSSRSLMYNSFPLGCGTGNVELANPSGTGVLCWNCGSAETDSIR
jgi:hypothetical protein